MKNYPAIILVGGLGTRLQGVINDVPKPMAPVNGKPFLHYVLEYLARQNISDVIFSVGYKYESIKNFFGDEYLGITIRYSIEESPLGTGGAIKKALGHITDYGYVLNGDTFFDVNLSGLKDFYFESACDVALALKYMKDTSRYGAVILDESGRIIKFHQKGSIEDGLISGGIYFMHKDLLRGLETPEVFSFEKDILEQRVGALDLKGKVFDSYFIDIGVPADYEKAQHELKDLL